MKKLLFQFGAMSLVVTVAAATVAMSSRSLEKTAEVSSSANNNNQTEDPNEQFFVRADKAIVGGFPPIPVYPEAELDSSYKKTSNGEIGYQAKWYTSDGTDIVSQWYVSELENTGWQFEEKTYTTTQNENFFIATKGQNRLYLGIEVEVDDGSTEILVEFPVRKL